jgi:hypothetical protein
VALTEVDVCNMALRRLGISMPITSSDGTLANITSTGLASDECVFWYPKCRDRVLEWFPWPFALKYQLLTGQINGDAEVWSGEWEYAYPYPADCHRILRFVDALRGAPYSPLYDADVLRGYITKPWPYEIKLHDGTLHIFTDVGDTDAKIEYIATVTAASDYPDQFASAVAWLLASELALPMSVDVEKSTGAYQRFALEIQMAAATGQNELSRRPEGDGEFIASRNS